MPHLRHPVFDDRTVYEQNNDEPEVGKFTPGKPVSDPRVTAAVSGPQRFASDIDQTRAGIPGHTDPARNSGDYALTGLSEQELRSRLQSTSARIDEAKAFLSRVDEARSKLSERRSKAYAKVDKAEKALRKAREDAQPVSVTEALLSGIDPGPDPIKHAKARLAEAEAGTTGLRELSVKLGAERAEGERELAIAETVRDKALAELVAPFAAVLLQQHKEAQQRVADIAYALSHALPVGTVPDNWQTGPEANRSLYGEWLSAIQSLKTDADAQLPVNLPAVKRSRNAA